MRKYTLGLLTLVMATVFLSGCDVGGRVGAGYAAGVVIKKFKPDITAIYPQDSVYFEYYIENIGEMDATSVVVEFYGLGRDWTGYKQTDNVGNLDKAQPDHDIPGDDYEEGFEVTAPEKAKGEYEATVQLSYRYGTEALGTLKIYNDAYLKSLPPAEEERLRKTAALENFEVSGAPVTLSLASGSRSYTYREGSSNTAALSIEISNIGGGQPYNRGSSEGMSRAVVRVDTVEIGGDDCTNSGDFVGQWLRIPSDGDTRFVCKFEIPTIEQYESIPIEIDLSYDYVIRTDSSIEVLPELE